MAAGKDSDYNNNPILIPTYGSDNNGSRSGGWGRLLERFLPDSPAGIPINRMTAVENTLRTKLKLYNYRKD